MDHRVRDARITDVDRIVTLLTGSADGDEVETGPEAVNLLRQLVYLPQAAVLVAEERRRLVGVLVLALRPSVREGGMIATIDALAVEPDYEEAGAREALLTEAMRSARNKGCLLIEAQEPADAAARDRWLGLGFEDGPATIVRPVGRTGGVRDRLTARQ